MIKIQNNHFKLEISTLGAEMKALYINDINILWKANELWNSQSPVLFPIIGSLKDGYYIYNEKKYEMPVHGFAKSEDFKIEYFSDSSVKLVSTYSDNTLKMYPFKYELGISYTLLENVISVKFEVKNIDDKAMYFAIGLHPGFSYNGLMEYFNEKYSLEFIGNDISSINFSPTFVTGCKNCRIKEKELSELSNELVNKRTLCFSGVKTLKLKTKNKEIRFENSMSHLAFWQKNPENPEFICIEPWNGLPDYDDTNHKIEDKRNIIKLEPNQEFSTEFQISI